MKELITDNKEIVRILNKQFPTNVKIEVEKKELITNSLNGQKMWRVPVILYDGSTKGNYNHFYVYQNRKIQEVQMSS